VSRAPAAGVVATTNHFQSPALVADQHSLVSNSSGLRLTRVVELLDEGRLDVERAQAILADQRCLDPELCIWARLLNAGTIYSTVFEPAEGRIWVRAGDHDDRRFEPIDVPGARPLAAPRELTAVGV